VWKKRRPVVRTNSVFKAQGGRRSGEKKSSIGKKVGTQKKGCADAQRKGGQFTEPKTKGKTEDKRSSFGSVTQRKID